MSSLRFLSLKISSLRHWRRRLLAYGLSVITLLLVIILLITFYPLHARSQTQVFEQVWQTVDQNFFDPKFNGVDWPALRQRYRPLVAQTNSPAAAAQVINQMLAELKTSHTRFYTPDELAYYQLLGIFQPKWDDLPTPVRQRFPNRKFEYTGLGVLTRQIEGRTFVSGILKGTTAAKADIKVGDELLQVDGQPYQPLQSFAGKAGKPVKLLLRRTAEPQNQLSVTVAPQVFDAVTMFAEAQKASVQVLEQRVGQHNRKIGYYHIWSNAADPGQEDFRTQVTVGKLRDADALVLDLREGWGGGSTSYVSLFTGQSPSITSISRKGSKFVYMPQWRKPVVLLVNQGSRSAKEIVAYGFQAYKIGPIVGSPTPGAVVAGSPFFMNDGSMLYLAVADVLVDQNQRLEGRPIQPDIPVPFELPYAQGNDPQLERALQVAAAATQKPGSS